VTKITPAKAIPPQIYSNREKEDAMPRQFSTSNMIRLARSMLPAIVGVAGILASAGIASADQGRCVPRKDLGSVLEQRYAEVPVAVGLIDTKTIIEVFAREDGDTWTIVASRADGTSCIIGAGNAWRLLPIKPIGPGA
jgi:hypothetical protein